MNKYIINAIKSDAKIPTTGLLSYLVLANSFSEAEEKFWKYISDQELNSYQYKIRDISITIKYQEVLL